MQLPGPYLSWGQFFGGGVLTHKICTRFESDIYWFFISNWRIMWTN